MSDELSVKPAERRDSPAEPGQRPDQTLPEFPPDDPTMSRTPVTHSSYHRALGLTLRLDTNDLRVHRAALDSFGPIVEPATGASPDALIRIFVHHVDEEPGFRSLQPLVRSYDGTFWIAASRSSVISGNAGIGSVFGFISDTIASNADYLRTAFVQPAFLQIAQPRSIAAVHSACLARDGLALILRGDSGAGKSTLAYAALRRGYSLVAEDVIFLRSRSGRTHGPIPPDDIELHGLPWTLHLLPDSATLFPELAHLPAVERPDGRHKLCITIQDHFPGQALPNALLGPLVFITRGQHPTPRLTTLSRPDALARLGATAIHYERDEDTEHHIWDAFLSHPAYLLETSTDPHANAATLDNIVG